MVQEIGKCLFSSAIYDKDNSVLYDSSACVRDCSHLNTIWNSGEAENYCDLSTRGNTTPKAKCRVHTLYAATGNSQK